VGVTSYLLSATPAKKTKTKNFPLHFILRRVFAFAKSATDHSVPTFFIVMTKYIIVSGGVVSGIGKGVIGLCPQAYFRKPDA
jgi:hypothetical protein